MNLTKPKPLKSCITWNQMDINERLLNFDYIYELNITFKKMFTSNLCNMPPAAVTQPPGQQENI